MQVFQANMYVFIVIIVHDHNNIAYFNKCSQVHHMWFVQSGSDKNSLYSAICTGKIRQTMHK